MAKPKLNIFIGFTGVFVTNTGAIWLMTHDYHLTPFEGTMLGFLIVLITFGFLIILMLGAVEL